MRLTVVNLSRAIDQDQVDQNPPDQRASISAIKSNYPCAATSPKNIMKHFSPT